MTEEKAAPVARPRRYLTTEEERRALITRLLNACRDFDEKKITLKQLICRVRGPRMIEAVQSGPLSKELKTPAFWLYMDVNCYAGSEDHRIISSARWVAAVLKSSTNRGSPLM